MARKKLELHWKIIIGLCLGVLYGVFAAATGLSQFTNDWISPLGTIFINLLKLIAVPLILASLIVGVASLSDLRELSRIGGKTIAIYLGTTVIAVSLGLSIVNIMKPGHQVPSEMRERLQATYENDVPDQRDAARRVKERTWLDPIVSMVPENIFDAASNNQNMLQVVFVALLFGIGLIQLPQEKARPLLSFFESLNLLVIRLVDVIMIMAPVGVFALIAGTITTVAQDRVSQVFELLGALGFYCLAVALGLGIHMFLTYSLLLRMFTPMRITTFFTGIAPAQLVAFSTSSSGATLPVTMERCQEKLGVSEEVSSFVLPLGATVNMDGTALYQSVAAVFIAQTLGMQLDLSAQLTIILTAVLASIGSAGIPGAGIIMLVIILEAIGVPSAGIALIIGVDRPLDMIRTMTNITGDATVAILVAASEGQLKDPALIEATDEIRVRAERTGP